MYSNLRMFARVLSVIGAYPKLGDQIRDGAKDPFRLPRATKKTWYPPSPPVLLQPH